MHVPSMQQMVARKMNAERKREMCHSLSPVEKCFLVVAIVVTAY